MQTELKSAVRKLSDFKGKWDVTRVISHVGGADARFEGTAIWAEAPGGLAYHEKGAMMLAGHAPMQAERRYFWADDLSVFFENGRLFHHVPPQGGTARHWCDPDTYELTYDFRIWPRFDVRWRVTGPRKDYMAQTEYRRQRA